MKNLIIISFLLLAGGYGFGQLQSRHFEPEPLKFINDLGKRDISEIGYLKYYCVGYVKSKMPCGDTRLEFQSYVFWVEKRKLYIKKYDNCGGFKPVEFSAKVFGFYYKYKNEIKDEFVRDYTTMSIVNNDTTLFGSIIDHSCHTNIIMLDSQDTVYHYFNHYNMSGEGKNVNYKINNELKLKLLYDLFSEQLQALIREEELIRE